MTSTLGVSVLQRSASCRNEPPDETENGSSAKTPYGGSVKQCSPDGERPSSPPLFETLYGGALPASRSGPLYGAFPYPTKIAPEAIALLIAAHTAPGDTVFDSFAGSGTTGLAALLCEDPTPELRQQAKLLPMNVQWGARNAVLYELGVLGAFIGRTLTNPPQPEAFRRAAEAILAAAAHDDGWMYQARDPALRRGSIRHVIWSDLLLCPRCGWGTSLWESCVSRAPAAIGSRFSCRCCAYGAALDDVERVTETVGDDVLGAERRVRARRPVWLYGSTGKQRWSRPVEQDDLELIGRIADTPVPTAVPVVSIPWGDLYRRGYHQGITHLHHFYTRRDLIAFARLWERTQSYAGDVGAALRIWLLSYNASHATVMTRVVAKSGHPDLVVTSAQPGVLYVSGLPVEKNLFLGLRRKLSTINRAFELIHGRRSRVEVRQGSSCSVDLPKGSIDYAFTDPPFGGNIPYAEVSFLNEAWLGRYTDRTDEAIISTSQHKTLAEYRGLLTAALCELQRILKHGGKVTLVFHSASAEVWRALQGAYRDAGFAVECAGVLDKTQGSFKQVTTRGAVRGDPLLLLARSAATAGNDPASPWSVAQRLREQAKLTLDPVELTVQRLYSRLIAHYLSNHQDVPIDAESYYHWHREQAPAREIERVRGHGP